MPGVDLSAVSDVFLAAWETADLVISKGQSNFESMPPEYKYTKPIVYMAAVKDPFSFNGIGDTLNLKRDPQKDQLILLFHPKAV